MYTHAQQSYSFSVYFTRYLVNLPRYLRITWHNYVNVLTSVSSQQLPLSSNENARLGLEGDLYVEK